MENYDICVIAVPEDAAIAETLAQSIRNYRLPRGVTLPNPALDYRRIYVDSTGSDLDEEGKRLLDHSRYLVMICSPDTKASPAIRRRLDYFRNCGLNENIVAVIVRGEPVDAFPESFIQRRVVQRILPDMRVVEREETIEPVAADLRGDTPARRKQLLRLSASPPPCWASTRTHWSSGIAAGGTGPSWPLLPWRAACCWSSPASFCAWASSPGRRAASPKPRPG